MLKRIVKVKVMKIGPNTKVIYSGLIPVYLGYNQQTIPLDHAKISEDSGWIYAVFNVDNNLIDLVPGVMGLHHWSPTETIDEITGIGLSVGSGLEDVLSIREQIDIDKECDQIENMLQSDIPVCTCSSRDLFNYGCQCGAFKREMELKKINGK